ncbi:Homeodomain-like protein, partial [Circinella umbellata]
DQEIIVEEGDYQRRKRYSREELDILLQSFNINPRPSRREKQRLAALCHVDTHQIQVWFQNHRAKLQHQSRLEQNK